MAEEKRDLSLIYKISKDSAEALRRCGVDTIDKLAVCDVETLLKIRGSSIETLRKAKVQARSLVEKKPIFIGVPETSKGTKLNLYFDIEGDSAIGVEYLFGFWVVGDPEGKYAKVGNVVKAENDKYFLYFLAEIPEQEGKMWDDFVEWVDILPEEYTVYHFADYESGAIKKLGKKYKKSKALERFQENLHDLQKSVKKSVVFPLYFYSIKDIAKSEFLNFKWRHAKAGGGQSVYWYEQWLQTKERQTLQDIIDYNEDDVRATEHLHLWMKEAAGKLTESLYS